MVDFQYNMRIILVILVIPTIHCIERSLDKFHDLVIRFGFSLCELEILIIFIGPAFLTFGC